MSQKKEGLELLPDWGRVKKNHASGIAPGLKKLPYSAPAGLPLSLFLRFLFGHLHAFLASCKPRH